MHRDDLVGKNSTHTLMNVLFACSALKTITDLRTVVSSITIKSGYGAIYGNRAPIIDCYKRFETVYFQLIISIKGVESLLVPGHLSNAPAVAWYLGLMCSCIQP